MLGHDAQEKVEAIVHEYMQEKHDECKGDKAKVLAFVRAHDRVYAECWNRIAEYEKQATEYRNRVHVNTANGQRFRMRKFNWIYEDEATIRSVLRRKKGKPLLPKTALEKEQAAMFAESAKEQSPWRMPYRKKGEIPDVLTETDGQSYVSQAREQYLETGEYPERKAEGMESILADMASRKEQFAAIEKGGVKGELAFREFMRDSQERANKGPECSSSNSSGPRSTDDRSRKV